MRKVRSAKLLGEELRKLREQADISQEELAFRARISRNYVSELERGLKSPTIEVLLRITQSLDTSAAALVGRMEAGLK